MYCLSNREQVISIKPTLSTLYYFKYLDFQCKHEADGFNHYITGKRN